MPIYKLDKKKDGQQCYRVRINYKDNDGKYRQLTRIATGLAEAKLLETELQLSLKEKPPEAERPQNQTVKDLYNNYIENKKYEVRETTLDKAKSILETHALPTLKDVLLSDLDTGKMIEWKNTINQKGLSTVTKKNIYSAFRAMLIYGTNTLKWLKENPLTSVGNFKDPYEINKKEKLHYYTAEEFKKFIARAQASATTITDRGYYVFFAIAYYTGLRKGEIHALRWTDIDGASLSVRRSISQKLKGEDRETPPKNKSSYRTLQMPTPLIKILNEHKAIQKTVPGWNENLFVCGGARPLRDTSVTNKNQQFAKEAGLEPIRIHDFRHSHASLLANAGINIQEIARRLGHSKVEITWNTYSHLYPREEERAVAILNEIEV